MVRAQGARPEEHESRMKDSRAWKEVCWLGQYYWPTPHQEGHVVWRIVSIT